ncbi:GntR family transcriptional regulator [Brevirhabdus pacifica]|nr:GntR family transcriptional regulator [Brevirhabdus pacifica]
MNTPKPNPPKRADQIAKSLEDMIFQGEFADGDRLDEQRLAERFGTSRTPVREALQKLSVSGLVAQIPQRGVFVQQPGPVELMEMFEVMAELEAVCGRFAAIRITDEALDQLRHANQLCQQAVDEGDTDGYYFHNEDFHRIIYSQSGNRFLEQEARRLSRRLRPFRRIQLRLRGRMRQSLDEHLAVVQALTDSDPEGAGNALRDHVAVQNEKFHHLMNSFEDRGSAPEKARAERPEGGSRRRA